MRNKGYVQKIRTRSSGNVTALSEKIDRCRKEDLEQETCGNSINVPISSIYMKTSLENGNIELVFTEQKLIQNLNN